MKPIKNLPDPNDNRYVADVIRERRDDRRWLLVLAILLCWQMAVEDARAIVVQGVEVAS